MTESFRSWAPGWGSSSLEVLLDEDAGFLSDIPTERESLVLSSCITSMAQAAALANDEADLEVLDLRMAKAVLVFNEMLTILDLPDRADIFEGQRFGRMEKYFEQKS